MTPAPQSPAASPRKGLSTAAIVALSIAVLCCPIGGLAAIAIPNFITFSSRSKQGECKANLKQAYVAARAFNQENETYTSDVKALHFEPWAGNRYAYFFASGDEPGTFVPVRYGGREETSLATAVTEARQIRGLGLTGQCPKCELTIGCVGNVDGDSALDVWSVSTGIRMNHGKPVPAGTLVHHLDDTRTDDEADPSVPEISQQ